MPQCGGARHCRGVHVGRNPSYAWPARCGCKSTRCACAASLQRAASAVLRDSMPTMGSLGHRAIVGALSCFAISVAAVACSPPRSAAPTSPPSLAATPASNGAAPTASSATLVPTANNVPTTAAKPSASIAVKGAYAQASSVQGVLYVAREKGFFARYGLDVQLSQVGGTQQVAALLSGDIQFGALGANEVANADLRGADLVMIATCSDLPIFSLFANRKYANVGELAGQAIGVTTAGSATDAAAHLFLKQFDMLDKVNIIPAGGTIPSILAALDQGNIAAGVLSPPTTARASE